MTVQTDRHGADAPSSPLIRVNSLGFLPEQRKQASIAGPCTQFTLYSSPHNKVVLTGKVTGPVTNADTGEQLFTADFSGVKAPGLYYLDANSIGRSATFRIDKNVYNEPFYTVMRGMYLWRCGVAVSGKHQGQTFAHAACHRDDGYLDFVGGGHTKRDGTGGWHDAGDYNKYVVNAGVTVGVMLLAWEQFRDRLKSVHLNLPESGNGIPDYLNEIKFEMEWLLKMQAPDGAVYHKLTTQNFGGFILPEREKDPRFFTPASSAATASFVAMTAMFARVIKPYDAAFAARCLSAATKSYQYLVAHPEEIKADLRPFRTGGYETDDKDDRLWAVAELWQTTGDATYLKDVETRLRAFGTSFEAVFDWGNVGNLGKLTYLQSTRPGRDAGLVRALKESLIATAEAIVKEGGRHGYARPFGTSYYWGCNGSVARQCVLLQSAYRLTPKRAYIDTSLDAIGHLFGRNVFGRSFVTGIGANPPLFPHDRRAGGDTIEAPWPGYLIGGGWPKATDWKDEQGSYQTNEIAINWNGALIYALAGFIKS